MTDGLVGWINYSRKVMQNTTKRRSSRALTTVLSSSASSSSSSVADDVSDRDSSFSNSSSSCSSTLTLHKQASYSTLGSWVPKPTKNRRTSHHPYSDPVVSKTGSALGDHWFQLANASLFGRYGVPQDPEQAVAYLYKALSHGHVVAEGVLGFCFEFGIGVERDFERCEQCYLSAAGGGKAAGPVDVFAMARLAFLRKYGRPGVKIDRSEADAWTERVGYYGAAGLTWLFEAAEQDGDSNAQYCLGVCYHDGVGVQKDEKQAFYWYQKSAQRGNPRGQGILGYCYGEGFGVPKDVDVAMVWYRRAAEQGETVAIYNVGYCYEDGIGVQKDVLEAVKWYRISANQGNAFAQNSLGYCYEDGIGVAQDFEQAAKWYRLSAEQGYP
ncbi:hypothetical protein BZG36_05575, partial [Bifiguratus adelaidae]